MTKSKITVIVPRLFPSVDGLGDYGLRLSKQLRKDFSLETEFIVCDPAWSGDSLLENFSVKKIPSRNSSELCKILEQSQSDLVLVHYVGYGYAKRGSPFWLIKALSEWKQKSTERKLITMFHEIYAFGPVWTSQYWTSPLQKYVATKLALMSEQVLTSKLGYSKKLQTLTKRKFSSIPVLPVFSNVGEPKNILNLNQRNKTLVIFGGRGPRMRVYKNSLSELAGVVEKFGINSIIDIGPAIDIDIQSIGGRKIEFAGVKSSEEISAILSNALIGFINYPIPYLTKSGIFAAYTSHGVLPVVASDEIKTADDLQEGIHYLKAESVLNTATENIQSIASNSYAWYGQHDLTVHARTFARFLRGAGE